MRKRSASKSSPLGPTMTISPSSTQRSGSMAADRDARSSGKYRFIGLLSRLWRITSSPSRNTSVRKPSHLGSNCQPSPPGKASAALDSIGASGGTKGRRTTSTVRWFEAAFGARADLGIDEVRVGDVQESRDLAHEMLFLRVL